MDATGTTTATRRVLVVDDDDAIREVAQMALQIVGGWDVTTARNGQEALVKALAEQPDAILLDVMMPDMDGPTTIVHLKADPQTVAIPVILLTAKVQSRDHREWATLDMVGVIAKPFDPMSLAGQMATMLGWTS
ncbi:MAG: response regulator [Propionibacteriaceae bacterium]